MSIIFFFVLSETKWKWEIAEIKKKNFFKYFLIVLGLNTKKATFVLHMKN